MTPSGWIVVVLGVLGVLGACVSYGYKRGQQHAYELYRYGYELGMHNALNLREKTRRLGSKRKNAHR